MSYKNKPIARDIANEPIPQVWDEVAQSYQPAVGTNGRQHTILFDADGNEVQLDALLSDIRNELISANTNPTVVGEAPSLESRLDAIEAALGGTLTTQPSGSNAAGDDYAGTANGEFTLPAPTRLLDFYNGGDSGAVVSNGSQDRLVPPGSRFLTFDEPAAHFTVAADGDWIATAVQ